MATGSPGYHRAVWAGTLETGGQGRHKVDSLMTGAHYPLSSRSQAHRHWSAGCRYDDESALFCAAALHVLPAHLAQAAGAPLGGKTVVDCQVSNIEIHHYEISMDEYFCRSPVFHLI